MSSEDPAKWSMADVSRATGNFSAANIAGQGGFATVYKGRLGDGSLIAVKRAKKVSNEDQEVKYIPDLL